MIVYGTDEKGVPSIQEAEVPQIGPGEALVKVAACGVCSSDTLDWYVRQKSPIVLGHEPAGIVTEVGPGVAHVSPGDRVFFHHHAPCLGCVFCRRGRYVLCETWKNTRLDPGGLAEYVRVPETNLSRDTLKIPDGLPIEAGCLVEPLGTVIKAFSRGRFLPGMSVLVIGLGIMGQMAIAIARRFGAGRVFGADKIRERLDASAEFGAEEQIDVNRRSMSSMIALSTGGHGIDFVFVGPGSTQAMEEGIACAGAGGTVLFFTMAEPGKKLVVEPNAIYFKEVDLVSSYSCGPEDTREAMRLIAEGEIPWRKFITHRFPIQEAPAAFRKVKEARDALKVIVEFPA